MAEAKAASLTLGAGDNDKLERWARDPLLSTYTTLLEGLPEIVQTPAPLLYCMVEAVANANGEDTTKQPCDLTHEQVLQKLRTITHGDDMSVRLAYALIMQNMLNLEVWFLWVSTSLSSGRVCVCVPVRIRI
jgi:hypothetical protein